MEMSLLFFLFRDGRKRVKREDVAVRAETADDALDGGRDHRRVAEFFAGMHIGKVQFDHRHLDGANGVVQGDRGVGIGTGIDGDASGGIAAFVDPVDQIGFSPSALQSASISASVCPP
jgi:hypothetical protein